MELVRDLKFNEGARVNPDRLVELCVAMGDVEAEKMISMSIDTMMTRLEQVRDDYARSDVTSISEACGGIAQIAENIGMDRFARVARDVEDCALHGDVTPLAATLCRLHRVADSSLRSVWDVQDMIG